MADPDQQVRITRLFDAPRDLVFRAWTDPDHLTRWWGPDGFKTPRDSIELDLRAGGRFTLQMVEADGAREFWVRNEILELVEPELLVMKSEPMPEIGLTHSTITRVEFEDEDGMTRMTLTDGPYGDELRGGTEEGWNSSFDKLERLLA